LKQYGLLTAYYCVLGKGKESDQPQAKGIASSLCDVRCMLLMHGIVALLQPVQVLCKNCSLQIVASPM
jgi:hypothetical protein